jgi:hypothetical protein
MGSAEGMTQAEMEKPWPRQQAVSAGEAMLISYQPAGVQTRLRSAT